MNRLTDKVAIVTGASSGVGESISKLFAAEGAIVFMIARRENELKRVADEISAAGGKAIPFAGSVCKGEDIEKLFRLAYDAYEHIDIVVNNAGTTGHNYGIATVTEEDCYELYETNTMGSMRCFREGLKYMLPAGKGTFVSIGSVGGVLGKGGAAYAMTKGGQVALAKQVAFEYSCEGIRSNVICPDGIRTPLLNNRPDPHVVDRCKAHSCTGIGICEPEEVAYTALFLASDESSGINGQAVICNKGTNLC